jgi:hypothetical protein
MRRPLQLRWRPAWFARRFIGSVRTELRPKLEDTACDVCGRTILKGERVDAYLAPGGQRKLVCELCTDRAYQEGWIRESAHDELPASTRRHEPRRGVLGRLWRRRPLEQPAPLGPEEMPFDEAGVAPEAVPGNGFAEPEPLDQQPPPPDSPPAEPAPPPPPPARREVRHVRAVPTNAQVKVERGIEIFNASAHSRTIAGIAKTLGEPWASAMPVVESPSEVELTVAWELSWYRYRIDLGDADDPVTLRDKGDELDQLDESARDWNASSHADGTISLGVRSEQ